MAKKDNKREPDVKVHHTKGCGLDGRKDAHTHDQDTWHKHIDSVDPWASQKGGR